MPLRLAGCLDVFEYGQYCMALGLKPESGLAFLINCQRIDIPGNQFSGFCHLFRLFRLFRLYCHGS